MKVRSEQKNVTWHLKLENWGIIQLQSNKRCYKTAWKEEEDDLWHVDRVVTQCTLHCNGLLLFLVKISIPVKINLPVHWIPVGISLGCVHIWFFQLFTRLCNAATVSGWFGARPLLHGLASPFPKQQLNTYQPSRDALRSLSMLVQHNILWQYKRNPLTVLL